MKCSIEAVLFPSRQTLRLLATLILTWYGGSGRLHPCASSFLRLFVYAPCALKYVDSHIARSSSEALMAEARRFERVEV